MPWRAGSSSRSTSALRAASRAGDAPPCRLPWIWRFSPASRTLSGPRVGTILREAGRIRCFGSLGSITLTEIVVATHAGTAGGHRHHTDQVRRYRFGGDTFAGGVACHSPRLRNGGPTPALCGRIRDRSRPRVDGLGPSRQGHLVNSRLRGTCPRYGCLEGSRAVDGTIRALSCPSRLPHLPGASAGGSQDPRRSCRRGFHREPNLDLSRPLQGSRVRVPRCDCRLGPTAFLGRDASTRSSGAYRRDILWQRNRKLHVLDSSRAPSYPRPGLPQR